MRYIRAPGSPKGLATNRVAVNPVRRQYPQPTPGPATYSSPTTPAGSYAIAKATLEALAATLNPNLRLFTVPEPDATQARVALDRMLAVS